MALEESRLKKKSCRRSSFTPGRTLFPKVAKVALYQDIDLSLPAELRLAELTKKCVMYSLDVLSKEMSSFNDHDIREEVETSLITKINSLTNENAFYDLCHKKRYTENPANKEVNNTLAHFEMIMKKLNKESNLWEKLKNKTKKMVEDSELKDVKKMIMFEDLPEQILNSSASYMPDTKVDHNSIRKACLESLLQANCSMNALQITHNLLSDTAKKLHSQLVDTQSNLIKHENTDVRITANETPRRLLRQMPVGSPGNTDEKIVHQS